MARTSPSLDARLPPSSCQSRCNRRGHLAGCVRFQLQRTQRRCTRRLRRLAAVWQAASIWPLRWQQPWLRRRVVTAAASDRHRHRLQPAAPSRRSPAAPTKAAALLNSASLCGIALLARSQPTDARSATRFPFWSLRRSVAPARVARRPRWSSRRATLPHQRPCAPRAGQSRSGSDCALPARLRRAPLAPHPCDLELGANSFRNVKVPW